jgi:hypothetical protein
MKGKHLIFDFETLGKDITTNFAILECSYVAFDADRFTKERQYSYKELLSMVKKDKFDVREQIDKYGYYVDKNTKEWWLQQDQDLIDRILKISDLDISLHAFCANFLNYAKENNITYWWTRSNVFDPIILYRIFKSCNLEDELNQALKFWLVRDTRTFIDAKLDFCENIENGFVLKEWEEYFKKHDSSHDIVADVMRLQKITLEEE